MTSDDSPTNTSTLSNMNKGEAFLEVKDITAIFVGGELDAQ